MQNRGEDSRRLQGCINDLVSLLALPALWSNLQPSQVVSILLDVLLRLLRLDFAYARLNNTAGDSSAMELCRIAPHQGVGRQAPELGRVLERWLALDLLTAVCEVPNPLGEGKVSMAHFWMGLDKELGVVVVGSQREGFPTGVEKLLFKTAVNQAVIELQRAEVQAVRIRTGEIERINSQLHAHNTYLNQELNAEHHWGEIIGQSKNLKKVLKLVEQVAPTDACVLVQGETGTGKELIARAIHRLSNRNQHAFVKLNCAAIPTGLLEAELFGHEKGAFTGAIAKRIGRFELAHHGTIFLDEVGDIPLELQAKLLRVLQERELERLGSTQTIQVDTRLIAASNCDLKKMVGDGKFRSDLYYRLHVFPITLPPLRERVEDIPLLVRHFVEHHARKCNKVITSIAPETMTALCCYPWPGNVRELENFIERSVILSQGSTLEAPLFELKPANAPPPTTIALEDIEREHILRTLTESNWIISGPLGAARKLGMKRTSLQYKMQKLGIIRPH